MTPQKIAVIGSGISGLVAAYMFSGLAKVTLFEARSRLGGHTHTHRFEWKGDTCAIDTGFIVLNNRTYPTLHTFFQQIGAAVQDSDMSFSYYCKQDHQWYAGTNINGLFSKRSNICSASFYIFLYEVYQFGKKALEHLQLGVENDMSLRDYIQNQGVSARVCRDYLLPMLASIWSAPDHVLLEHPAHSALSFMHHHGLLNLVDRPQWQTVVGGSDRYIDLCVAKASFKTYRSMPVLKIKRQKNQATIFTSDHSEVFDLVIVATHADQVLPMLDNPLPVEVDFFSTWTYETNNVVLHTDTSLMPPHRRAWASWNYVRDQQGHNDKLLMTYHMNRLQGLQTYHDYFVTLNPGQRVDPERSIKNIEYKHPVFSTSVLQQRDIFQKQFSKENPVQYVGSYFGFGFHEDGAKSATSLGEKYGLSLT